jgi:hypothetical protein
VDASLTASDASTGADASRPTADTRDTWTVESPPSLSARVVAGPVTVSRGQGGVLVQVELTNGAGGTAGASIGAAALVFSPLAADFVATRTDTLASVPGGGLATLSFSVSVSAGATTGSATIDASITATDSNSGADASRSTADTRDAWTVQTPPSLLLTVDAAAATVSRGQTGVPVTLLVLDTGQATADLTGAALAFGAYASDFTATRTDAVLAVVGGATASLTFQVAVGAAAATGARTVDGAVTADDANSGADVSRSGADTVDSWTVQTTASLTVQVLAAPTTLTRAQTGLAVDLALTNTGEATANLTAAALAFNVAGDYTAARTP